MRHASWNECILSKYVYVEWLGEVVGKKETHHQRTPQPPPATILGTVFTSIIILRLREKVEKCRNEYNVWWYRFPIFSSFQNRFNIFYIDIWTSNF